MFISSGIRFSQPRPFTRWWRAGAVLFLASFVGLSAAGWPQWRGPEGQGHANTSGLPLRWSESSNIVWKTVLPGRGWSSPVIGENQVWLTTAIETAARPEDIQRRLKSNTGDQPLTVLEKVELRALCVDEYSGKLTHDIPLLTVTNPQWAHEQNSYASPTPMLDSGRLYAHFGAFGTACVDTRRGQIVWTNNDPELVVMHENGPGSSPVLWRDKLIIHLDGSDHQFAAALDTQTGKLAWKTPRSGKMNYGPQQRKSYGTPILLEVSGRTQLISPATEWLYGLDPATGTELWRVPYGHLGYSVTPRPVAGDGMIFTTTGAGKREMLGIRLDPAGPQIVWRYGKGVPSVPSPLLVRDNLYFVDDYGFLTCLDAKTGTERYRERLGGNFFSSPTFADGRIHLTSREGITHVIAPGNYFKVLSKNTLTGRVFASLAVADHAFFLRTDEALYRISDKRP